MSNLKIFNEDCLLTLKRSISFDLVLTSPPYNMTKRKGGYADRGRYDVYKDWKTVEEYLDFTVKLFNSFNQKLRKDGVILYNFSYSIENPSLPYALVSELMQRTEFYLVDTIIWKKKNGIPFPANARRLSRNWEFVWVFVRKSDIESFITNRKVKSISVKGQKYYECVYNFVEAKNNDEATPKLNEATYSSELCEKLLSVYAVPNSTVYDPFIGTGTTALACKHLNLNCIGSELSKAQCTYTEQRLSRD